jgi:hypothetical protein
MSIDLKRDDPNTPESRVRQDLRNMGVDIVYPLETIALDHGGFARMNQYASGLFKLAVQYKVELQSKQNI